MATKTLGSNATNTLTALQFMSGVYTQADIATIANGIRDDKTNLGPIAGAGMAFSNMGQLYVPNRGFLQILPGDWVGIDANGWPILVSANSIAGGFAGTSWTHN